MRRFLLNVILVVLAFLAGVAVGTRRDIAHVQRTGKWNGTFPSIPVVGKFDWKTLPPLKVQAQGHVSPQTGGLSLETVWVSTRSAADFEAHIHVGGTLEKPTWTVRSLKKKHVRLRFEL